MLERLSFQDLDARSVSYDRAVARSERIDRFCSSSFWVLPAIRHLMPSATPAIGAHGEAYAVLARSSELGEGSVLYPLEATWGLPCPLVGPEAPAVVDLLFELLGAIPSWRMALLTGLVEGSALWRALLPRAAHTYSLREGPSTRRYVADLTGGVDGFLDRRSAGFRRNLRKSERRAAAEGVEFQVADEENGGASGFERVLDVERRSWKGRSGVGIDREPMRSFYEDMNVRLVARGARRLCFARREGEDVAYALGGIFGDTYRGLQFSYDERYAALSLGSLCQMHEIHRLAGGATRYYDLGTEVEYKRRWGETVVVTRALVLSR